MRAGLALTAQTELQVAQRPSTSSLTTKATSQLIPALENAIQKEKSNSEDVFQGQICMAWLRSTMGDWNDALANIPSGLDKAPDRLAKEGGIQSRWTHVCIVKGAYIRGKGCGNGKRLEPTIMDQCRLVAGNDW